MKIEAQDTINRAFPVEPAGAHLAKRENVKAEQVKAVGKTAEAALSADGSELRFTHDRETGEPVIRVVDRDTQDVIDQIPRGSWHPWPPSKQRTSGY